MKQFVSNLQQLAILLVYVAVVKDRHVTAVSTPDLQQTMNVLQAQVASLIEHREQNVQLSEQLKELREEVVILREKCRGTKNTATRLKWLESSVSEARGQISELGAALDRTTTSVTSLKSQVSANSLGLAFTKSGAQRLEEERHYKQALYENEVLESTDKKTRHQRYLRKRVDNLETRMILLEQEGRTVGTKLTDINEKLGLLEGINSTSVDKVHASMLELLESVEALETKVDTNLPTVQKEISRTELNLGQLMQQTAVMKEEQENQKLSVKALGEGISALQQKISTNNGNAATSFYNLTYGHNQEKERCNANDVVNQLKSVIHQYDRIVTSLPTACPNSGQSDKIEMLNLAGKPRLAACDKGWTLVQRRKDGTVQFNKDWEDYAMGFGTPQGEFWLGNEALHSLTNGNNSRLRVDMIDIYGRLWIAEYANFRVGDRSSGFKLEVSGYSGNASDALDYQNGMQFSARDSDRDISNTHCAANYEGGWWFSHCQHANLNGRYNLGLTWFHAAKNEWIAVAESTMKLWTH